MANINAPADSTSVLQSFSINALKAPAVNKPLNTETPVNNDYNPQDERVSEKKTTGKVPASNINFQENTPPSRNIYAPAIDEQGNDVIGANGKQVYVQVDENKQPILDKAGNLIIVDSDFNPINTNKAPETQDVNQVQENKSQPKGTMPLIDEKGEPILGQDGKQLLVKTDSEDRPVLDQEGNMSILDSQGKEISKLLSPEVQKILPATYEDGKPMLDKEGNQYQILMNTKTDKPIPGQDKKPILFDSKGEPLKPEEPRWTQRIGWGGFSGKMMAKQVLMGTSFLSIPHTIAKYVVKKEVSKVLSESLKISAESLGKVAVESAAKTTAKTVAKASGEVITASLVKSVAKNSGKALQATVTAAAKEGTELGLKTTVKTLTETGKLGKGLQMLTMTEARTAFGAFWNPIAHYKGYSKAIQEGAEGLQKVVAKEIGEKGVVKGAVSITGKTMTGASEKALQTILKEGTEAAVKETMEQFVKQSTSKLSSAAVKKIAAEASELSLKKGPEAAMKFVLESTGKTASKEIVAKTLSKTVAEATAKGTVVAAEKGSVKFASKMAAAAPLIGVGFGVAITAWDAHDAYKKTIDPRVTKLSAGLAWTTVGLDAVTVAADASAIGAPVGWVATGLSIGTSVLSDVYKYKK